MAEMVGRDWAGAFVHVLQFFCGALATSFAIKAFVFVHTLLSTLGFTMCLPLSGCMLYDLSLKGYWPSFFAFIVGICIYIVAFIAMYASSLFAVSSAIIVVGRHGQRRQAARRAAIRALEAADVADDIMELAGVRLNDDGDVEMARRVADFSQWKFAAYISRKVKSRIGVLRKSPENVQVARRYVNSVVDELKTQGLREHDAIGVVPMATVMCFVANKDELLAEMMLHHYGPPRSFVYDIIDLVFGLRAEEDFEERIVAFEQVRIRAD